MSHRVSNFPVMQHRIVDAIVAGGDPTSGGRCVVMTAAAALLVGDLVFISAANTVNKSNTIANYTAVLGVVVGGTATQMEAMLNSGDVGLTAAAAANDLVLVLFDGFAYVTAGAAVAAGAKLIVDSTTAGRVKTGAITTDLVAGNSGSLAGVAIGSAAGAASVFLMQVHVH